MLFPRLLLLPRLPGPSTRPGPCGVTGLLPGPVCTSHWLPCSGLRGMYSDEFLKASLRSPHGLERRATAFIERVHVHPPSHPAHSLGELCSLRTVSNLKDWSVREVK